MLSHVEVDARIQAKAIQIWYSFLPPQQIGGMAEYHAPARRVDLDERTNPATLFFLKNRYSTHLHLTTGPIVQAHNGRRVGGRKSYPYFADSFDMRDRNEIVFEPFEILTILTNEQIALDGKTAAIVTPRVTNSDAGLIVTTAYIDPYYEGIMRVVVCNMTPKRQTLRVLEPLAQCFFFDLSSSVDDLFKEQFPQKTKFYGHTWEQLLNSAREPFPQQKRANPDRTWFEAAKRNIIPHLTFERILKFISLFGGLGGIGAGILYVVLNFHTTVEGNKILKTNVDDLNKSVSALDKEAPRLGSSLIVIPAGATEGRRQMNNTIPSVPIPHVWLSIDRASATNQDDIDLRYELTPSGSSDDLEIEVIARLRNGPAKSELRIPVLWMITR